MKSSLCLFSAPHSFMPEIEKAYQALLPTLFREIWQIEELKPDQDITAWVVNPGQSFIIEDGVLEHFKGLEVLVTPSTGRNHIDLEACRRRAIPVYSLVDDREGLESISSSAEFSFLLLLNALRRLDVAVNEVSAGRWRQNEDEMRGNELSGKRVGLVGLGRIGRRLARYCVSFDAEVVYYDPYVDDDRFRNVGLSELFMSSDVVCVCCGLTDKTNGFIDKHLLRHLKTNACFVNTARGEIVNHDDLVDVINTRHDLRVGLDVLTGEVTNTHLQSPLIEMHRRGRIVITPHVAGATVESQSKAAMVALKLLKQFYSNRLDNQRSEFAVG